MEEEVQDKTRNRKNWKMTIENENQAPKQRKLAVYEVLPN